jgi:hypothetical protein
MATNEITLMYVALNYFKSMQRHDKSLCSTSWDVPVQSCWKLKSLLWISAKTDCIKGRAILVCPRFVHGDKEGKFTKSAWLVHDDFSELSDQAELSTSSEIQILLVYYGNLHGDI